MIISFQITLDQVGLYVLKQQISRSDVGCTVVFPVATSKEWLHAKITKGGLADLPLTDKFVTTHEIAIIHVVV